MRIVVIIFSFLALNSTLIAQINNPFDLIRAISDSIELEVEPVKPLSESTKLVGDNPFNISHIPIRKNQYQEIEKLNVTRNSGKETISLSYLPLWIIIISMCLIAYQFFIKSDHLAVLVKSISNDNFMRMTSYDENQGRSVGYIVGYFVFLLNFSLFLYLILVNQYGIDINYLYIIVLGLVVMFFLGKHVVNSIFGWLFNVRKEANFYDFVIITNYNLMAAIFLVLNIFLVFGADSWLKPLAVIGIFLFIIFLLSRYYKGLKIGHSYLNNYFIHFFIYFCAFEISPWLITYTIVKNLI